MTRRPWNRRGAWLGWLGAGLALSVGCNQLAQTVMPPATAVARGARGDKTVPPEKLPSPKASRPVLNPPTLIIDPPPNAHPNARIVPITLDTVLRLANDQNGQINIARAKVHEAFAAKTVADKRWLPEVLAGPSYYRHEGGIQDFNGNLIHSSYGSLFAGVEVRGKMDLRDLVFAKVDAERRIWQRHGELVKLTSENLLDAANTYIDLLAARAAEAVGLQLEAKYNDLLTHAQKRAQADKRAEDEVHRVKTELQGQKQINRQLRGAAVSATAKLVYLLGLDPHTELVVLDSQLVPFDLVDANVPAHVLVEQALRGGPGIRALEGLIALIENARAKAGGSGRYLPAVEVVLAEGAFGAGPGDNLKWDNRLDVAVHARWNLTDLFTAKDRQALVDWKIDEARRTYEDLRGKLALGVHEAREASLSGRDQIRFGEQQVQEAQSAYDKSHRRLDPLIQGPLVDVLFAVRSLSAAQFELVRAIRGYDQAQIRLLVVTGLIDPAQWQHANGHGPHGLPCCPGGVCPPRR